MPGSDGPSLDAALRVLDDAPVAMAVVGADDRVVYANPALSRLTARCRHDLVGRSLAELIHPDDRAAAGAGRRSAARGEVLS